MDDPCEADVGIAQPVVHGRRDDRVDSWGDPAGDLRGDDRVGEERAVGAVLLHGAHGHDDRPRALEERLDLRVGHLPQEHGGRLHPGGPPRSNIERARFFHAPSRSWSTPTGATPGRSRHPRASRVVPGRRRGPGAPPGSGMPRFRGNQRLVGPAKPRSAPETAGIGLVSGMACPDRRSPSRNRRLACPARREPETRSGGHEARSGHDRGAAGTGAAGPGALGSAPEAHEAEHRPLRVADDREPPAREFRRRHHLRVRRGPSPHAASTSADAK